MKKNLNAVPSIYKNAIKSLAVLKTFCVHYASKYQSYLVKFMKYTISTDYLNVY